MGGGLTSISHWRVGLARLGSSGSRSSSAFRTSFVPSRLFLLLLRRRTMLAQASPISKPLWGEPPAAASGPTAVAGGGGGGVGAGKGPRTGTPLLASDLSPLPPPFKDLSRTIDQNLNGLCPPPPGIPAMENPMRDSLFLVMSGKEDDAAATAAGAASRPPSSLHSARSLLFGRLQGRGWPGGSVSGRVWLGVGRDDD